MNLQEQISRIQSMMGVINDDNINPYIFDNPEFIDVLENTITPSSFICSYVASAIKMLVGDDIKIYGFSTMENPDAKYFVEENGEDSDEGHHFAVMNGRYIIDPWVYENFNRSVFDLKDKKDKEIISYLYGDKNKWTDITKGVEGFEFLFPKTYKNLKDYYSSL